MHWFPRDHVERKYQKGDRREPEALEDGDGDEQEEEQRPNRYDDPCPEDSALGQGGVSATLATRVALLATSATMGARLSLPVPPICFLQRTALSLNRTSPLDRLSPGCGSRGALLVAETRPLTSVSATRSEG